MIRANTEGKLFSLAGRNSIWKMQQHFSRGVFSAQKEKSFSFYCTFISIHVLREHVLLIQGGWRVRTTQSRDLCETSIGGEKLLKRSQAANRMTQIDISAVQCLTEAFRSIRSDPISRIFPFDIIERYNLFTSDL